jgi:hypothetical protein
MIDPEVTAWCPRGDHADSGLLRCFGGADGVVFGAAPSFGKGWYPAGRQPVARAGSSWWQSGRCSGGHHADAKAVSGWLMGS